MATLEIAASDITAIVPALPEPVARTRVDSVLAKARVRAPELFVDGLSGDVLAAVKAILVDALARWGARWRDGAGEVSSESTTGGPFSINRTLAGSGDLVDEAEWGDIVTLCSGASVSKPAWSFPPAPRDHMWQH